MFGCSAEIVCLLDLTGSWESEALCLEAIRSVLGERDSGMCTIASIYFGNWRAYYWGCDQKLSNESCLKVVLAND